MSADLETRLSYAVTHLYEAQVALSNAVTELAAAHDLTDVLSAKGTIAQHKATARNFCSKVETLGYSLNQNLPFLTSAVNLTFDPVIQENSKLKI